MRNIKNGSQSFSHVQRHKDRVVRHCIQDLLKTLSKKSRKLQWVNTLESDSIQRLETVHDALLVKITHISPNEGRTLQSHLHKDETFVFGKRDEEYRLEVTDKLRRYGRANILREWFGPKTVMFNQVEKVFKKIDKETQPAQTPTNLDRVSVPQCIREVEKALLAL